MENEYTTKKHMDKQYMDKNEKEFKVEQKETIEKDMIEKETIKELVVIKKVVMENKKVEMVMAYVVVQKLLHVCVCDFRELFQFIFDSSYMISNYPLANFVQG